MYKTLAVIMTCLLGLLVFACASAPAGNSANNGAATTTNLDKGNLPPGLSASPLPVNGTTPGIPDPSQVNVNMKVPGSTPTPGIPDPANVKVPKGATPTPGIPSEAEIKKMMNASGKQTVRMEANTPPAGNITRREDMRQMQNKKKIQ
jgi:hypothetical protein